MILQGGWGGAGQEGGGRESDEMVGEWLEGREVHILCRNVEGGRAEGEREREGEEKE
jgi:hypothetical protein